MIKNIELGIYSDIPIETYHRSPGISNSGISLILDTPARYYYEYITKKQIRIVGDEEFDQEKENESIAKTIGSMVHCLVLEIDKFDSIFVVKPKIDKRTTNGKSEFASFMDFNAGKTFITQGNYDKSLLIAESLKNNKIFKKILSLGNYKVENSIFWNDFDNDVKVRSRPDFFNDTLIIDLKTTKDASEEAFEKSIFNFGYHRQAAIALDGFEALGQPKQHFCILAVETKPPFLTNFFRLKNDAIEKGREEYKIGLGIYGSCLANNVWPGYSEIINDIGLPSWAQKRSA
jgi:exodeoxyribonuclease VIII